MRTMQQQQLMLQMRMQEAQINNLDASSNKMNSETEGTGLNNYWLGATMQDRIESVGLGNKNVAADTRVKSADATLREQLNGFYAENPDFAKAIAESQSKMNQQIEANIDSIKKNIALMDSEIGYKKAQTRLTAEQEVWTAIQSSYTETQRSCLMDQNLRDNYQSPSYLLHAMKNVANDAELDDASRAEALAFLSQLYNENSHVIDQKRQFDQQDKMQDKDIALGKYQTKMNATTTIVGHVTNAGNEALERAHKKQENEKDRALRRDLEHARSQSVERERFKDRQHQTSERQDHEWWNDNHQYRNGGRGNVYGD